MFTTYDGISINHIPAEDGIHHSSDILRTTGPLNTTTINSSRNVNHYEHFDNHMLVKFMF